jgi:hypothetical protein
MWNRRDIIGWCHDLIWGDIWIGTDDKWCCPDQIKCAMSIRIYVKGSSHDKFYVIWELEQMVGDDVMT